MKLPNNYYSSWLNKLGFHDTRDFKQAKEFSSVSIKLESLIKKLKSQFNRAKLKNDKVSMRDIEHKIRNAWRSF